MSRLRLMAKTPIMRIWGPTLNRNVEGYTQGSTAATPWVYPSTFLFNVGPQILIMGVFAMSLNLLIGYTGMVSFGHAAYFGVGAYTLGILLQKTTMGLAASLVAAVAAAAGAALVIGFFCVRLGTIYFSMLTLAFAQIVYTIVIRWTALTGGDQGLIGGIRVPPVQLGPVTLHARSPLTFYYLVLLVATAAFAAAKMLVDSPWGLLLRAVRDNAHRVGFLGASERGLRLAAFVAAGAFAVERWRRQRGGGGPGAQSGGAVARAERQP